MAKYTNSNKKSNARKLVPAVGMLAVSAVMLSTSTYAWFTLNKSVEVKNIQLSATAGDSLEIAACSLGDSDAIDLNTTPTRDNAAWKQSIAIGDYYEKVGILQPASSINGKNLFYVDDNTIFAGGAKTSAITANNATAATLTARSNLSSGADFIQDDADTSKGYFIDIPIWLRTSKISETEKIPVYCKVTIKDATVDDNTKKYSNADSTDNDLRKAVRVAIVPQETYESSDTNFASPTDSSSGIATIYELTSSLYDGKAIQSATATDPDTIWEVVDTTSKTNADWQVATDGENSVSSVLYSSLNLPVNNKNKYSGEKFVIRVWVEGQSTYCYDATAGQSWNIDLKFALEESELSES